MIDRTVLKFFVKEAVSFEKLRQVNKIKAAPFTIVRAPRAAEKVSPLKSAPLSISGKSLKISAGEVKASPQLTKASDDMIIDMIKQQGVPESAITPEMVAGVSKQYQQNIGNLLGQVGVDTAPTAGSQVFMPRRFHSGLRDSLATQGIFVPKVTGGKAQRGLNDVIRSHELDELRYAPQSLATDGTRTRPIASHVSPEIIMNEANIAATLPGAEGDQIRRYFSAMRKPEFEELKSKLTDPKAIKGVEDLLAGKRISRHMRKRINRNYLEQGSQILPKQF